MSHNLDQGIDANGQLQTAMLSVREHPWHRLGAVVPDNVTAEEGLTIAHLDYDVTKEPLTASIPTEDGVTTIPVPGKFATVRQNPFTGEHEALGVVGSRYEVVQNRDNTAFLDALVGESGAHYETMGALAGGRKTFVSMKAPKGLMIGGRDAVDLYLVAYNSHDGSSPFGVIATPIRVVCQNTLTAALGQHQGHWTTRHTAGAAARIEEAQAALRVMWSYADEFADMAEQMIETKIGKAEAVAKIDTFFPIAPDAPERTKNYQLDKRALVLGLYQGESNAEITGTKWGLYNALTEYADWSLPVRGGTTDAREDARAERIAAGGAVATMKHDALRLVLR